MSSSKASILINGSPDSYVRYQRGLRQGDPLSLLLFVLVTDVLCSMFSNALCAKILVGVLLGDYRIRCNLYYADDLLVLATGGLEDLRIVKLILYVFEGLTGLVTNFSKTCLFSSSLGILPDPAASATLNCERGLLPVTYLSIPIVGRRPRRQDWEGLILKVRRKLSSWKVEHLSLGGKLTLVNSVLSVLPIYWMSLFRLPCWVIKEIDRFKRDFLWSDSDIDNPKCRLVRWKNLCRSRDQGGWGILDLGIFNQVLLGKWYWKFMNEQTWSGADVVQFNYGVSRWNLYPRYSGRISFFWKGVLNCLPALRNCVNHGINSGMETLFWKDNWLNRRAPMFIWQEEFSRTLHPNGSIFDLSFLLYETPFAENADVISFRNSSRATGRVHGDSKGWRLTGMGSLLSNLFMTSLMMAVCAARWLSSFGTKGARRRSVFLIGLLGKIRS